MPRNSARVVAACLALSCCAAVPRAASADVLANVRARGFVRCAGIVRPGLAVPAADGGRWFGLAVSVCRAVAAGVLGDPARMTFRPYVRNDSWTGVAQEPDDISFVSGSEIASENARALQPGPVIFHDASALLVPERGVAHAAALATKSVCVEPGSPADRALTRYFRRHEIELREHPFQETDEMRQAYGDGKCDALAGPLSTLANVRADPKEGRPTDRILPELLADDPIFASTAQDARWCRVVWWTFSVLVDAEDAGVAASARGRDVAIPGVPPAVASELGLRASWARDVLSAGGNYAEIYRRDVGAASRLRLARGANALWRSGGLIYGLGVE